MSASMEGYKAATEICKQIITLSTGAVAFTITFLEKFARSSPGPGGGTAQPLSLPLSLTIAWFCFGAAVLFALLTLMGITGAMEAFDKKENGIALTPGEDRVVTGKKDDRAMALLMLLCFFFAVVAMIWTGFRVKTA